MVHIYKTADKHSGSKTLNKKLNSANQRKYIAYCRQNARMK